MQSESPIFDRGPFPHFQKSIGLFRPAGERTSARAVTVVVIGWGVLCLLVLLESIVEPHELGSFVRSIAVHARSLIAAPLFVLAESISLPRLEKVATHFVRAGLVKSEDYPRFEQAAASTRRLMNSALAEVVAILLAYAVAFLMLHYAPQTNLLAAWSLRNNHSVHPFSLAGWWQALVSLPLLLVLMFSWIWRSILWGRFLVLMSRLDLRLIAAHPDGAAGLKFVDNTMFAFMPVAFSLGVIGAGSVATRVVNAGMSLRGFYKPILGLIVFILILFVSPLMIFCRTLLWQKRLGVLRYGTLAHRVGRQFEKKWLEPKEAVNEEALEAPDFSATTDLYQIVANVHQMNGLPFDVRSLIGLILVILLPFVPVAMLTVPLDLILEEVAKLLL